MAWRFLSIAEVEPRRGCLYWRCLTRREGEDGRGLVEEFLRLKDGPAEDVVAFVRRHGVLANLPARPSLEP